MSRTSAFLGAGKLNKRITISRKVISLDPDYGTEIVTWADFATIWAQVQDALPSKAESVTQGLVVSKNYVRVRFYWLAGVDSSMRVTVLDDTPPRVLQIVGGPAEIGFKEWVEIMCEKLSS